MSLQNVALIMAPNLFGEPKAAGGRVLQQFASEMPDSTLGRANCLTACADDQRASVSPTCGQMAAARTMSNPLSPSDGHPIGAAAAAAIAAKLASAADANHSPQTQPRAHQHQIQHTALHGPLSNQDSCSGAASCIVCLRGSAPSNAQSNTRAAVSVAAATLAAIGAGEPFGPNASAAVAAVAAAAADSAHSEEQVAPRTRDTITVAKSEATLMKLLIYYYKILIIVCFILFNIVQYCNSSVDNIF